MRYKIFKGRGRKPGQWRIPRKYLVVVMVAVVVAAFLHSYYRFDRRILPLVLDAAEMRIQTEINTIINSVVQEIMAGYRVSAADFILQTSGGGVNQPVLSVNTVLVNEICNAAAKMISYRLNNLEPELVSVPMGMALGLDTMAQFGPRFSFYLLPIGNALVDYESRFTAVGINQTHFTVWLTVESVVRIINPVHSSEIVVLRNVSLVDTIISGVVPDTYLSLDAPVLSLN
ncbi:MAG: sporulation protein YunB [Defluviitaleaceae bacterium]|nr:sporulation protein YunB [Defluviitaleaceae bacterium]